MIGSGWFIPAQRQQSLLRKGELCMGILDELLGGAQRQKEYRDFVDRYEQGSPS
jgi:aspartyl/asparaginyl-tRNA synthetase